MSDVDAGLVAVLGGFAVPIMGIIGWILTTWTDNWRKIRVSEHLAALKQTMIERGMSADEIERIIRAGMPAAKRAEPGTEVPARSERCYP
jgi:hypothetical protein